ncbi:tRNA (guanine(37)-N1)-methyltransferase 1 isoform X2 [Magnolia sinica]|uniref:tRNA (guanine(37)-N1)-methyltransferase 1 isoform X2 n=1 Tax=Magnolia sinica TaxID=86752 RepID=UPI002659225D|nr:tRNA (guanine(37)-N1)-methyltransferase 1 isoform X2 [Magnolia sinica]
MATATGISLRFSPRFFPFLPKISPLLPSPLFSTLPSKTLALTLTLDYSNISYGPSLHKGSNPSHPLPNLSSSSEDDGNSIDRDAFSRTFCIAALRVPADCCFALENRLRGHLLNWPRVRNVARVPGDDIDPDFNSRLLPQRAECDEDGIFDSVNRRIYGNAAGDGEKLSPVLYREKLVKSFNCRGFLKFRNLARISRPKMKNKRKKEEGGDGPKRIGKNDFVTVEVVGNSGDDEDLSGLLGDDFKGGRWRGPTRLLLLDERYADRGEEELPEAVKILEALLPKGLIVPTAFETVGHIAHLNLRDEHLPYKEVIAQVVLDKNKPKIQTVVNKIDTIQNDYRTMQLEVLAGNHSLVTTVVENGIRFHVDLAAVYWNSRLATERQRLINSFTNKDVVCDVFSGVGPLAVSAAKKVKYVYANDLNPSAIEYLERNIVLNKLERKIEVYNMDGRRFIDSIFSSEGTEPITQVVMNLPNEAAEYLDTFRGIYRRKPKVKQIDTTLPKIHVYGFSKAQDPEFDFHERIRTSLTEVAVDVEMHRVRLVAPGKWMLCASFVLPEIIAFARY